MSLSVLVKSASGLPNVERFGKSDPMCVIVLQGEKKSTKVIDNNLDPEWNETLKWTLYAALSSSEQLHIRVFDYEKLRSNRLLGTVCLPLQEAISRGSQNVSTALKDKKGQVMESKINLELTYKAPEKQGGTEEPDGGTGEGIRTETSIHIDGEREETGGHQGSSTPKRVSVAELGDGEAAHRARRRNMARSKLPNKPSDWQVRIHVLEARRLVGGLLNPIVKVVCGTTSKQTSARKGTNDPLFNEMLYFSFTERPQEMFDRMVEIKVLHNKVAIKDALIGSFKFDLGMVYDEPEQSFVHKWLLLADPDNPSSGNKGYLKISINVIGSGDQPKSLPSTLPQESVDIESNLLRPAGVQLQPATLAIKIYRGEDMPPMDPVYFETVKKLLHFGTVHKELVDPYCKVSFAGKKGKTSVIWHDQEPKWNHQINLGIRFPSMSERIKFQVMDKDKVGNDDFIGTTYISLSQISAGEEKGFLPTFGPCFLNIYGSPREFTDLPDKYDYLNKGMIEGVAYRGRIMVELEVQLGNHPTVKEEPILEADQTRIRPFLRRCGYKLYGVFFSATMIHPANTSVEFEVSIGNYGNKLDTNTPVQPSTTLPSNPFYDGQHYYYMPWLDEKPCVVIESQWEDCSYRVISMNIILGVADRMDVRLTKVKKEMALVKCSKDAVKGKLNAALTEFIDDLSYTWKEGGKETWQPLPPLKEGTKLDKWRRNVRIKKWNSLRENASHLRDHSHKLEEMVSECEDYIATLRDMAIEPQQCIPDVIIWMLAGDKRVAYSRIPAHTVYYDDDEKGRGKLCGKIQTLFLTPPAVEDEQDLKNLKDGAQVRLMLWLEMEKEVAPKKSIWATEIKRIGGDFNVYAETYENEMYFLGSWRSTSLTRPHWSDAQGKVKQEKDDFVPPPGWSGFGEWVVHQPCTMNNVDDSREEWLEEIYENQARYPFSSWPTEHSSYWTDVHNDPVKEYRGKEVELTRDDILCPEGWKWSDGPSGEWHVDKEQAVDKNGWEYCLEVGLSEWVPYERNSHLFRRRRWVRCRIRDRDHKVFKKMMQKKLPKDGWEYARMPNLTYHVTEHKLDFARRRRWVLKLEGEDLTRRAVFHFKSKKESLFTLKDESEEENYYQQVPRVLITFHADHTYQLRAYIYQARDMYGSDKSGLSDPYAILSFLSRSARTRTITQTVSPTWDQTILINDVRIYGETSTVEESPPAIDIVFMDKDDIGCDEFIGRTVAKPVVRLSLETTGPHLDWYPITRYNKYAGELLAAFELLLDEGNELPFAPPAASRYNHHIVPFGIRPVMQWTRIEILCWGVRAMKRFQLLEVTSPLVEFECNGKSVRSEPIKNTKENPNFPNPVLKFDVYLPIEELYTPPLNIKVMEERSFGRCPLVGTHTVKSLSPYLQQESLETHDIAMAVALKAVTPAPSFYKEQTAIAVEDVKDALDYDPDNQQTVEFDWWSKYNCSIDIDQKTRDDIDQKMKQKDDIDQKTKQKEYTDQGYDTMKIIHSELETEFDDFQDLAQTFCLYRGKGSRDPDELKGECVGLLKGTLKVYALPENKSKEPPSMFPKAISTEPIECVVRVYIIRAENLMAQDPDGKSDPYIKVKIGKGGKRKEINDKDHYIPSNLNPVFGKMFELPATLPMDHTLTITVMDWDRFTADDLIGETTIDLENRFISQYRGTCGLPNTFCKRGVNKWRDRELPVQILEKWCEVMGYPAPTWIEEKVIINGADVYTLRQFENGHHGLLMEYNDDQKKRLALHILKSECGVTQLQDKKGSVKALEEWCDEMEYQAPIWFEEKVIINGLGEYTLRRFEHGHTLPWEDVPEHGHTLPWEDVPEHGHTLPWEDVPEHGHTLPWEDVPEHGHTLPWEDVGDPKQRLALYVIKAKCKYVPEHVEERTLYNPITPGISQGILHMWVDIFPNDDKLPPAVDISPRKPDKYELRVVVYNTKDVVLDEISVVTGDAMSDIYVKGWLRGQDETQKTDVHYRSMDGEGNFNWRMVLPFEYLPTERMMVVKKKEHFYSLTKTEIKVPPRLTMQVWDNDIFTPDDFIGTINFDLTEIPEPVQDAAECTLNQLPQNAPENEETVGEELGGQEHVPGTLSRGLCICCKRIQETGEKHVSKLKKDEKYELVDLFHKKRLKGWWPVFNSEFGKRELMGKLELEIEILTEAEALLKPAGKARDDPNMNPHLDEPNRPATSFLWFTSPLKSFQYIIWRHYKWHIVGGVTIVLLIVLLVILIYTAPSQFMSWVTDRLLPV